MVQGGLKKVQGGLEPPLAPHFPRLCVLPTLPVKSLPDAAPPKRRKLNRFESATAPSENFLYSCNNAVAANAEEACLYASLSDVISEFHKFNPSGWRFFQIEDMLHLTFHDYPYQHAIARISLLMKQSEVKFNVAINGIHCMDISDHLNEEKMSLATTLMYLLQFRNCVVYETVEDKTSWLSTIVLNSFSNQMKRLSTSQKIGCKTECMTGKIWQYLFLKFKCYLLRIHFIELKNISCFNIFYTVDVTFLVFRFWFYKLKNVMIGLFSVLF